jgi:hypothetical protein
MMKGIGFPGLLTSALLLGSCSNDCVGRWSYHQFYDYPFSGYAINEQYKYRLHFRFSQKENVSSGNLTKKNVAITIQTRDSERLLHYCLSVHGGLLEAAVEWSDFERIVVTLNDVRMDSSGRKTVSVTPVRRLLITHDKDAKRFRVIEDKPLDGEEHLLSEKVSR